MQYTLLNNTDLKVSKICLGTVKYGTDMPEKQACRQMEQFLESGANFIDTAHVYGDWEPGEQAKSEHVIGRFLKSSGRRHDVILSTKGAHPRLDTMSVSRVTPDDIRTDIDESLKALQTDYIDLYFLHRDNAGIPAGDLLGVLEEARAKGKLRWYGCSNWSLPRIREADRAAADNGFSGFVCNQLMWSLADINAEAVTDKTLNMMDMPTYEYHLQTGKNAMAYTSAAHGYLSKRIAGTQIGTTVRALYDNEENETILSLIRESGLPVGEVSFAYLMAQDFPTVPIVTFRTEEQLEEGIRSCELKLPETLLDGIRQVKRHSL